MYKRIPIKNHIQEIQLITQRSVLALLLMCVLLTFLGWRLAYLQIDQHYMYSTLSTRNWLELIPVEPTRGLIYDRNGILLAENIPVFSVDIIPYRVKDMNSTIAKVKKLVNITDSELHQFFKQVKQHRRFDEIPLKLRLTEQEVARIAENQHLLPGVTVKARLLRHYPFKESLSHVLGYVGRINAEELSEIDTVNYSASHYIGKLGVEKYYEEMLHGKVGYEEVENDASGKPIRVLSEIKGKPGSNIYLTIDSRLQLIAEKALQGHRGAVVAIQPQTGEVLAMVSQPGYDPNIFVTGISSKDFKLLQQSEDKPLYNRALRGLYPPASTLKPFIALQALNANIVTPEYSMQDQSTFQVHENSHRFHDWRRNGHGRVNLNKAIASSCDIFFYDLAYKMGIKKMSQMLKQFGFGELTGIDLEDELAGVLATPEWKLGAKGTAWYEGDTILSGIGQGYMQATTLQLAYATAVLANRGLRVIPSILLAEQLPGQTTAQREAPIPLDPIEITDPAYWEIVINAMQDVVDAPIGTAHRFGKKRHYSIAAKTGTAQVSRRRNPDEIDNQDDLPEKLRDHHLFIAFAPVEKSKIALAIVTENSNIAVDAARIIFDYYLGINKNANRSSKNKKILS